MESLLHLALIWCGVYLAMIFADRTRLTPVLYFLAIGVAMSNLGLLPHEPDPFIRSLAEIGIIIIMFALGFEENPGHFLKSMKRSWGIAFFGGVAPFAVTYALADYFWHHLGTSLMCALAMTSTAVSLAMVSLKSEGLQTSPAAKGIITSAVMEDIASLALVAILIPIAGGQDEISLHLIAVTLGKAVIFFLMIILFGAYIFPHLPLWKKNTGGRGITRFLAFGEGEHTTLAVLLIALVTGLLAHYFGFHPAVGAYMAGLILREEYFHFHRFPEVNYYARTRQIVDNAAFSWIGPVFFVNLGTKLVFDWETILAILPHTAILTAALLIVQIASSALAARYTGGFKWADSLLIGLGMLGRAELAFIVMDIAYLQSKIISSEVFYTLMFTAFWLNVSVPVSICLWKRWFAPER